MIAPIIANLHVGVIGGSRVVELSVAAQPPRPLLWRLTVETTHHGNFSRVTQSGTTLGANQALVDRLIIDPQVAGRLVVTVEDETGQVISRTCQFGTNANTGLAPCGT